MFLEVMQRRSRARLYGGPPDLVRGDRKRGVVVQIAPLDRFQDPEARSTGAAREAREARVVRSGIGDRRAPSSFGVAVHPPWDRSHARGARSAREILATFPSSTEAFARAARARRSGSISRRRTTPHSADRALSPLARRYRARISWSRWVALVALLRAVFVRVFAHGPGPWGRWAAALGIPASRGRTHRFAGRERLGDPCGVGCSRSRSALGAIARHPRRPTGARPFRSSAGAIVDPLAAFDVSFTLSRAAANGRALGVRADRWRRGREMLRSSFASSGRTCAASIAAHALVRGRSSRR